MIYFYVLSFFVILGLVLKKSKLVFVCLICTLFFLMTHFNAGNDLVNLEGTYDMSIPNADYFEKSFLFSLFLLYLKDVGCSFFVFRIICFILWATAVLTVIGKYSKYPTFVVACCTYFPLIAFGAQIRNGVAVSFVYWAIFFLLTKENVYGKLLFLCFIFLGGLIHSSVFIYAIGIFATIKVNYKILLRLCLIISLVSIFMIQSGLLSLLVSITIGDYYSEKYFTGIEGFDHHHLFLYPGILLNLFLSVNYRNRILRNIDTVGHKYVRFAGFVMRFNIIMLIALPLMIISLSFYRVYQYMFILTVILLTIACHFCNNRYRGQIDMLLYMCFYFCVTFYYHLWQGEFFIGFKSI